MFGWQPSLATAHLGQFLGVWLPEVVLGPGWDGPAVPLEPGQFQTAKSAVRS